MLRLVCLVVRVKDDEAVEMSQRYPGDLAAE